MVRNWSRIALSILLGSIALAGCATRPPAPGTVLDEARRAGRAAVSFPAADEDYFRDMDQNKDGVVRLTANEIKGRNGWIVWTGGNDRFWDTISNIGNGALDFLKTLSSHPGLQVQPRQSLVLPRPGQRAVLREGDRSRSRALRTVARQA